MSKVWWLVFIWAGLAVLFDSEKYNKGRCKVKVFTCIYHITLSLPFYTDPDSKRELNFFNGYLSLLYFCLDLLDLLEFLDLLDHLDFLEPLGPLGGGGAVFLMTPQRFWTLHRSCKSPTYSSLEKQPALCVPNASTASNARIKRIMHTTWTSSR